ncbi:MAG: hypothetical protein AB9842_08245 [Bacteroidales bacterium]
MKEQILNWLKYDRSWNSGLALYLKYGTSLSLKAALNRQGENILNRNMLYEQLRKLSAIHQDQWNALLEVPVHNYKLKDKTTPVIEEKTAPPVLVRNVEDLKLFMPEEALKAVRLRDEFPFLSQENCPNTLKILVADMITAYETYRKAHEKLFTAENEEEIENFARGTVENYLDNRLIWEELNHYKETGTILGEHPIFNEIDEMAEIKKLSAKDLSKKKGNIRSNISRLEKSLEKGDKPELNQERSEKIASYKRMLDVVDKLLSEK